MQLQEYFLCTKKTKITTLFNSSFLPVSLHRPSGDYHNARWMKVLWVWNDMMVSNWRQNFHFWVNYPFKGLVHPKMKISLCFTHPQSIPGVYDCLLSDESNWSYIKNCPGPSKPYNGVSGCFLSVDKHKLLTKSTPLPHCKAWRGQDNF